MPMQRLALPTYLIGAFLVIVPFTDAFVSIFPTTASSPMWRFGATGHMSGALLMPLLGLLILAVTAALMQHRRLVQVLSAVCIAAGAILLVVLGLFVFDATHIRPQIVAQARTSFGATAGQTVFRLLAAIAMSGGLAIGCWRMAGGFHREEEEERRLSDLVMVGRDAESQE